MFSLPGGALLVALVLVLAAKLVQGTPVLPLVSVLQRKKLKQLSLGVEVSAVMLLESLGVGKRKVGGVLVNLSVFIFALTDDTAVSNLHREQRSALHLNLGC